MSVSEQGAGCFLYFGWREQPATVGGHRLLHHLPDRMRGAVRGMVDPRLLHEI
jgi:hypothetical protein